MRKRKVIKKVFPFALIVMVLFALLALGVSASNCEDHDWEFAYYEEEPTCDYEGIAVYECCVCGEQMTETVSSLWHSYEVTESVEATCAAPGYIKYTCENCGDSYTETLLATGDHDWEFAYYEEEPTCDYEGIAVYECSGCGEQMTETESSLWHSYEVTESVESTCTEGYIKYTCENCGDIYIETLLATGAHDWPADKSGVCTVCGATCTHDWNVFFEDETTHKYICLSCKAENGTGAHVWNWYSAVDEKYHKAGCAECAYTVTESHHFVLGTCSDCGASASATTCTHKWDDGVITKQPTTTESGIKTYTCTLCGLTKTAVIQAVDYDTYVNSLTYDQAFSIYEKIFDKYSTSLVTQIDYDKRLDAFTNLPSTTANPMIEEIFEKIFFYQADGDYGRWQYQLMENTDIGYWYAHYFAIEIFPDIVENSARSQYYKDFDDVYYDILAKNPSNSLDYQRGYDDAMDSVIDGNPIQGLFQAMWSSTLLFVSMVANGVGIGGITLMSVLITLAVLAIVWFIIRIVKG